MQSRFEQLQTARHAKLESLKQQGIDPFGGPFPGRALAADVMGAHESITAEQLDATPRQVRVAGRVVSHRPQGRAGFAHIQDGSGRIQLYVAIPELDEVSTAVWRALDLGDIVGVDGRLMHRERHSPAR